MKVRSLTVPVATVAVALVAFADAVARYEAERPLRLSAQVWPSHPLTLRSAAMTEIGVAAAQRQNPSTATSKKINRLASAAPLEPEPFLVAAALAQKGGEDARALPLLLAARTRDPRSTAARYLLADHYIRAGDVLPALKELSVLSRLVPDSADALGAGLAIYARAPGAQTRLRAAFRESPDLEPALLNALAADAANADLVLAIATSPTAESSRRWRIRLLKSLVDAGQYAKARAIWARFAGVGRAPSGLFNPTFATGPWPPPFNWTLAETGGGLAEASRRGLRVSHYGRKSLDLARQLTLLTPGSYQLAFVAEGGAGAAGQLRWTVRCLPSRAKIFDLPVTTGSAIGGQFTVPAGECIAQEIALIGVQTDSSQSADVTIARVELARVAQ